MRECEGRRRGRKDGRIEGWKGECGIVREGRIGGWEDGWKDEWEIVRDYERRGRNGEGWEGK